MNDGTSEVMRRRSTPAQLAAMTDAEKQAYLAQLRMEVTRQQNRLTVLSKRMAQLPPTFFYYDATAQ
eukprot:CAMPEP_0170748168 /NCGR_PEP_ID=MMETSP0437-20130122/9707_1 /TAXON_ID=0 /ORGANISM="Sexangularia sp." /LENGTH=66 /DNA_ID=CAMNT_0011086985 /DNA_START=126 /DNA_END=326 /DNA_ORIENTATION=-